MANTDLQNANIGLVGAVFAGATSSMSAAQDTANMVFELDKDYIKAADDANATATTAELVVAARVPRRAKLVDAFFAPNNGTGLTAVAANFAQIILQSRNGAGGAAVGLGQTNTTPTANGGTGNWSQWNTVSLSINAFDPNNAVIPAGGMITMSIAKQGAGVIVPAGTFTFRLQYL